MVGELEFALVESGGFLAFNGIWNSALEDVLFGWRDREEFLWFDPEVLGQNGFRGMSCIPY